MIINGMQITWPHPPLTTTMEKTSSNSSRGFAERAFAAMRQENYHLRNRGGRRRGTGVSNYRFPYPARSLPIPSSHPL